MDPKRHLYLLVMQIVLHHQAALNESRSHKVDWSDFPICKLGWPESRVRVGDYLSCDPDYSEILHVCVTHFHVAVWSGAHLCSRSGGSKVKLTFLVLRILLSVAPDQVANVLPLLRCWFSMLVHSYFIEGQKIKRVGRLQHFMIY